MKKLTALVVEDNYDHFKKFAGLLAGLGLATVREIVESRYGGRVSLSSTPGRGSTFTVTFPRSL